MAFGQRDLSSTDFVYLWVDGIVRTGLQDGRLPAGTFE
jgi:hypothetical protein